MHVPHLSRDIEEAISVLHPITHLVKADIHSLIDMDLQYIADLVRRRLESETYFSVHLF